MGYFVESPPLFGHSYSAKRPAGTYLDRPSEGLEGNSATISAKPQSFSLPRVFVKNLSEPGNNPEVLGRYGNDGLQER